MALDIAKELNIAYQFPGVLNIKTGRFKQLVKQSLINLGFQWHSVYYPKRFKPSGQNVYHLRKRKRKYVRQAQNIAKYKYGKSWRPLMLSRELFRTSVQSPASKASLRGGNILCKVTFPRGHATQKYVALELVKINKNELNKLIKDFKNNLIALMSAEPAESFKKGGKKKGMKKHKRLNYSKKVA